MTHFQYEYRLRTYIAYLMDCSLTIFLVIHFEAKVGICLKQRC